MPATVIDDPEAFLVSRINYEQTLSIPYGQRDFKLDRMRELMARLGNVQQRVRAIHVAGTKGKGSTAAMLAAVLTAAGYRTGLYSSPHLERVEERIAIDGRPCSHEVLMDLVRKVRPAVESLDGEPLDGPTYFEIITAIAFCHFASQEVDFAVLEVGLGGRLDSTNVCRPVVTAITSISFDHVQQLGNTLAAIAGEKAGIIKPGVPLVSGVVEDEPRRVIADAARACGARLVQRGRDFDFQYHPPHHVESRATQGRIDFRGLSGTDAVASAPAGQLGAGDIRDLSLGLLGRHQGANAAVAVAVLRELGGQGWTIPEAALRRGLSAVEWPARLEVLRRRPTVVLDAAHNVASMRAFLESLGESFAARQRILVFATTRDKDVRGMLELLLPEFDKIILTRYVNNPRGVPLDALEELAGQVHPRRLHSAPDPAAAWQIACQEVGADDLIAITGSFFIAGEMRAAMQLLPLAP